MTKYLILLIFSSLLMGQDLYDSNCLSYVKSNKLVRAKSDQNFLDKSKRTERYFYWDRINKNYANLVNDESLQKEASSRYSQNTNYSITKCEGDLNNCNGYKAYCIEQVATKGMNEEVKEWNDRLKNCLNPKYRELHPDYCDKDFSNSLLYLKRMANELSKTNKDKSPEVALFFKEAKDQFEKHYNDMESLLAKIKAEKEKKKNDEIKEAKKQNVANTLDICRDLIKNDDNDIGGKKYMDNILGNYTSCSELNEVPDLNTSAVIALNKMMTDVDAKAQENFIYPKVTSLAFKQSVKATAATYMRFFASDLNLSSPKSRSKFLKTICTKFDRDYCQKPALKAAMYIALQELDAETKDNPIKKISYAELDEDRANFNQTLNKANEMCRKIHKQAEVIRDAHKCSSAISHYDKFDRMSKSGTNEVLACERTKQKKFDQLNSLSNQNRVVAEQLYAKATGTISGHLLVTEDFRDQVDLPSRNWVKERCINDDGQAFNTITESDMNKGLNDLLRLNLDEISDISQQKLSPDKKKFIIKDYLKNNPNTVVELLNQNPEEEYAKAICGFVREIHKSDYYKEIGERAVIGVGIAAGVALSITGVGAPIGVPLLATVGAATALEAGSIVYDMNQISHDIQKQSQAAATGQYDLNQALDSIGENESELTSRKIDLAMTLSFGTLDIATEGFKSAKMFYKSQKALKTKEILGLTGELSEQGVKNLSYKLTKGLDNFRYHARKVKLDPQKIKDLTDAQKMELGAVFSKLSQKEQRALALSLSESADPNVLTKFLKKVSENTDSLVKGSKLDFNEVYALAQKNSDSLPNGKSLSTFFNESDDLLFLTTQKNNVEALKAKRVAQDFKDWHYSKETVIPKELRARLEQQLTNNGVTFKPSGNGYKLSSKGTSPLSRFTKRMHDLGVNVVYDPQYLKSKKVQGAYDPASNTVYVDNFSIHSNDISPIAFHEGSHVYGIEKYTQGIDDSMNLSFYSVAGSKIYVPDLATKLKHNNKIPYAEGFWAQETKVFSNEIRQNSWSKAPSVDALRRNSETLQLLNANAIQNSEALLKHVDELKGYNQSDALRPILSKALKVEEEIIKGKKVHKVSLVNKSVSTGPLRQNRADIETSIFAVTKEQKTMAKAFAKNPKDPKNLDALLTLFEKKGKDYKAISEANNQIAGEVFKKAKGLQGQGLTIVPKEAQKELIALSAKLSKTTKTPTPAGKVFNATPKNTTKQTKSGFLKIKKKHKVKSKRAPTHTSMTFPKQTITQGLKQQKNSLDALLKNCQATGCVKLRKLYNLSSPQKKLNQFNKIKQLKKMIKRQIQKSKLSRHNDKHLRSSIENSKDFSKMKPGNKAEGQYFKRFKERVVKGINFEKELLRNNKIGNLEIKDGVLYKYINFEEFKKYYPRLSKDIKGFGWGADCNGLATLLRIEMTNSASPVIHSHPRCK